MKVLTVKELINLLSECPEEAVVFGYSEIDEGDFPVEVVECIDGISFDDDDEDWIIIPHGCQGDSTVLEYWETEGNKPIVYLRPKIWREYC